MFAFFQFRTGDCAPATIRSPGRRSALVQLAGIAAWGLTACQKASVPFNGTDVTGADFGHDFHLTDANGNARSLADYRGKVVFLFFGFTQCPDVCPTSLSRAAEIKHGLGPDGERFQVLFVTIDPERDTPEVLKAYTGAFDPSFVGLYGDLKRTAETAREFKAFYEKIPTGSSYTMGHTALTYVFDPTGRLRVVQSNILGARQCAEDVRRLLS